MKPCHCVFALTLWATTIITPAWADDPLSGIARLLANKSMICADFIQTKSLRALKRPLVSKGQVIYLAEKGILWQIREPFPTRLLVKRDALVKWNDAGEAQRLSFAQSPIFGALARIFTALFTGEVDPLRKFFQIDSDIGTSSWQLTLTPLDKDLARIIARVRARGGRFVNELRIKEGRGDQTLIKFSNMTAQSCQLDNSEKGYFAQ